MSRDENTTVRLVIDQTAEDRTDVRIVIDQTAQDRTDVRNAFGYWLWVDGGVIGRNPSEDGGTWAWRLTKDGESIQECSGTLLPPQVGMENVTNNASELAALIYGLEAVLRAYIDGTLTYRDDDKHIIVRIGGDSMITLRRLFDGAAWNGIPEEWRNRAMHAKWSLLKAGVLLVAYLLDGHPSPDHLARNEGKRGRAVSIHNKWCDESCGKEAERWRNLSGQTQEATR